MKSATIDHDGHIPQLTLTVYRIYDDTKTSSKQTAGKHTFFFPSAPHYSFMTFTSHTNVSSNVLLFPWFYSCMSFLASAWFASETWEGFLGS
jgi:hypothetical protein